MDKGTLHVKAHRLQTLDPRKQHRRRLQLQSTPTPHGHPGTLPDPPTAGTNYLKFQHRKINLHVLQWRGINTSPVSVRTTARVALVPAPLHHICGRIQLQRTTTSQLTGNLIFKRRTHDISSDGPEGGQRDTPGQNQFQDQMSRVSQHPVCLSKVGTHAPLPSRRISRPERTKLDRHPAV